MYHFYVFEPFKPVPASVRSLAGEVLKDSTRVECLHQAVRVCVPIRERKPLIKPVRQWAGSFTFLFNIISEQR